MFSIFKKKEQKVKIPTAAEVNAMRESFDYEMQKNIKNIIQARIPKIKQDILESARTLKTTTTCYITLTKEEENSITRARLCNYVQRYFKDLGYIATCCYTTAYNCNTMFEYRIYLNWGHA